MIKRSSGFWAVAGIGGCLVLLACVAIAGFGVFVASQQGFKLSLPGLPALSLGTRQAVNKIVIVGNDRNLYLADPARKAPQPLTKDADGGVSREYDFPTWAPDSQRLAFMGVGEPSSSTPSATVYSLDVGGQEPTPLFHTDKDFPVYLYWAPNSQSLSFLTQKGDSLALQMAQAGKKDSAQEVESGNPLYWAWSPDGKSLLLHIDGTTPDERLSLRDWPANNAARKLSIGPGSFQSPQWSADGHQLLFSARTSQGQQTLNVSNERGEEVKTLAQYTGRIAFAWAPAGKQIAYTVTPDNVRVTTFGPLQTIDADGGTPRTLSDEDVLAFFWSPDGKRLAYMVPTLNPDDKSQGKGPERVGVQAQNQQLYLRWKVIDADGQNLRSVATFLPTEKILYLLPFFDQYAHSMTFWSPDGKSLVYAAKDSNDTTDTGTVFVAAVDGSTQPLAVADGVIGFWSWK